MAETMWSNGNEVVVGWASNVYKLGDGVVLILSHPRFGPVSYYLRQEDVDRLALALKSTLSQTATPGATQGQSSGSAPIPPADLPKAH